MGADVAFIKVHSTHTKNSMLNTSEGLISLLSLPPLFFKIWKYF